ncbi:hypothetical protein B0H14DRAFT_3455988 [Mycena olivaceomarginata]|nr:hypothetical protein B0H14DRAFT_3455988 [Mycena olivaceomarginata]
MFSSCIFFCMALNVPLVVVYNINGQAMEKILRCRDHPHLPHGTPVSQTCWYDSAVPEVHFRWVIGTQSSWVIIFAVGEVGAFVIIVGYLVTHELHLLCRPAHTEATYSSEGAGSTILKFRNIILRIGLYPLTSCVLGITASGFDLYESRKYKMEPIEPTKLIHHSNRRHAQDTILMLVSIAACAGRPLIYGLLAATDPSFIRALRALRHPDAETETQFCHRSGCLSTIVEIPPHVISLDDV